MNWYRINLSDGSIGFYELDDGGTPFGQLVSQSPNGVLKINRCVLLIPNGNPQKPGYIAVQQKQVNPMYACCDSEQEFLCLNKIVSFGLVDSANTQWNNIYENVFRESDIIKPDLKLIVPE